MRHHEPARGGEIGALGELYVGTASRSDRFIASATADARRRRLVQVRSSLLRERWQYDGAPRAAPWLIGIAAQLLRRRRQGFGRLLTFLSSLSHARAALFVRAGLQAR